MEEDVVNHSDMRVRELFRNSRDEQWAPATAAPIESTQSPATTSLLVVSVLVVSAVIAFVAVRAWFAPVQAAATAPARLNADTPPADTTLVADPAPQRRTPATLSIVTDPPGLRVAVDGKPRGVSPLMIDDLTAAEHIVTVVSDAGTARRTIAVEDGVSKEVVFSMSQSTAPVAGWVAISSPFPVELVERNEVVGTSGAAKIMLAAGRHDVVMRNEALGYAVSRTLDIAPGRVASLSVTAPNGVLNVNARPWADVLIDGVAVGQTPLANLRIRVGDHQITFRHPTLGERVQRVVVSSKGVNRVAVELDK